jgi:hypothetical protein
MKPKIFIIWVLFLSFKSAFAENRYLTSHVAGASEWAISIPAGSPSEVFESFATAIDIVDVVCDGQAVRPISVATAHLPILSSVKLDGQIMIYSARYFEVSSYKDIYAPAGSFVRSLYKVSQDAKTVEVRYRVRYPDKHSSEVMTVKSVDGALVGQGSEIGTGRTQTGTRE